VERVLQAADSASALIIACALVKDGRLSEVTPKTLAKKAREKSFAAGCDRDRIAIIQPVISIPEFLCDRAFRVTGDPVRTRVVLTSVKAS